MQGFTELTEKERNNTEGGWWVDTVSTFLSNKLQWTNLKNMGEHFYTPIRPNDSIGNIEC